MTNKRGNIKRLLVALSSLFILSVVAGCKTETTKHVFVAPPPISESGDVVNTSYALDDSGLFASVNGVQEIKLGEKIPQAFIDYDSKCRQEGVFISGMDSASFYYTQVVDLNKVQGDLISFDVFYNSDYSMKEVSVDVIDIYDAENKFSVKYCTASGTHVSNLLVSYNGMEVGCNNGGVGVPNGVAWRQYGTICYATNFRESTAYGHVPFHFGYDMETQSIGVRDRSTATGYFTALDLDNPIHIGEENLFKGFTTGEVYLKVTFGGINVGEVGAITITEIGGRVMSGDTAKTTPSSIIKFDRFTNRLNNLPLAQVGIEYPVPQAVKNDWLFGELMVGTTVTSPSGVTKAVDTSFVPTETGLYELLYTTKDINGYNVSKKLYVEAIAELPDLTVESDCNDDAIFFAGEKVVLPKSTAFGGSGANGVTTEYTFNGEKIQLDVDGRYVFTDKGTLKMKTTVLDYLGKEIQKEFSYTVVATPKLVLNSPLPTVIQSGMNYTLPDFSAVVVGDTSVNLDKTILVDGVSLSADRRLCVSDKDSITIEYVAGKGTEYEVSEQFTVKVIEALSDENIDVKDLFITSGNASVEAAREGIFLKANKSGDSIAFANPIAATYSELYFYLTDDLDYEYVEVTLTDALDAKESVKFRLYKDSEIGDNFQVQDSKGKFSLAYPFALEKKMLVTERYHFFYDNANKKIDNANSVELAKIAYNTQGYTFNGFSSGAMRIKWAFFGVTGNASFCVATLGNQRFGSEMLTSGDIMPPELAGKGQIPQGAYAVGSTVTIPATYALDVLQNQATAYVTLIAPNGEKLLNNTTTERPYELSLAMEGNYKLSYYITDLQDNSRYVEYTISSTDLELPVVSLDGAYRDLYKVGDSIKILSVVAADDVTASQDLKVTVVVYDYDYKKICLTVGEEFKFAHKGMYKIVYLVEDQAGNVALYTCEMWVI